MNVERPICTCGNEFDVLRAIEKNGEWFNIWYCRKCEAFIDIQKESHDWVHITGVGVMTAEEYNKLTGSKGDEKKIKEVEEMIRKREKAEEVSGRLKESR